MDFQNEAPQMDVSGVMEPALPATNPIEDRTLSQEVDAFLREGGEGLTYDEIVAGVQERTDAYLLRQAESDLENPEATVEGLAPLAKAHGNYSPEAAKAAMVEELQADDAEPIFTMDYRQYVADRQEAASYYSERYIQELDALTGYGLDKPLDRWKAGAGMTAGFITSAFTPGSFVVKMNNIIRDQFPDAPIWDSATDPNTYIQQIRQYAYGLKGDDRRKWADSMLASIRSNTWTQYDAAEALRLVFDGIEDPNREVTNANLDVALDAAGFALLFVPFEKLIRAGKGWLDPAKQGHGLPGKANEGLEGEFIPRGAPTAGTGPRVRRGATLEGEFRVVDSAPALPGTSVANVAARTPKGAERLVSALGSNNADDALRRLGTTPEQVVGSLFVPRQSGRPFLPSQFIDPMDQVVSAERGLAAVRSAMSQRLMDSSYEFVEDGWRVNMTIGQSGGTPFRTQAQAQAFASQVPYATTVESTGNGFVLRAQNTHYWDLSDPGIADTIRAGGMWRDIATKLGNPFGKGVSLTPAAQNMSTEAALRTEAAAVQMINILTPMRNLSIKERTGVLDYIASIEGRGTANATYNEFIQAGLSPKQAEAGVAYMKAADEAYRVKDSTARGIAVSEGYMQADIQGVGKTFARPTQAAAGSRAIDAATGNVVRVDPAQHSVYELVEDIAGVSRMVVTRNSSQRITDLPQTGIAAFIPNYMPRLYLFPRIVEEEVEAGVWVARYGANNEKAATETAEVLRHFTNNNIRSRPAVELAGSTTAGSVSELRAMAHQGLLNTGTRRPTVLTDLAGGTRMASPEDRLQSLVNSAATGKGVGLWARSEQQYLRNTWGEQFDLALAEPVPRELFQPNRDLARLGMTDDQQYREALARWSHVRAVTGTEGSLLETRAISRARNAIADLFFGTNAGPMMAIGREVAGQTSHVSRMLKTVGFAGYLQGHPLRQLFIQTANIPSFLAQPGAFGYIASGRAFQEMVVLQAAMSPVLKAGAGSKVVTSMAKLNEEAALFAASRWGWSAAEARALLKDFRQSGYFSLAKAHGADIDTLSHTSAVGLGYAGKAIRSARSMLGALGYDPAVATEARSAWLMARNTFLKERGRLPKSSEDFTVVNGLASALQQHMNRGGVLRIQRGMLGAVFQFYSAQLKAMSRLLFLESSFDAKTKARMAGIQLMAYGTTGYGFVSALDAIEQKLDIKIPSAVRYACLQGILGTLFTAGIRAATGDKQAEIDYSGAVSPMSNLKQEAIDGAGLIGSILGLSEGGISNLPSNMASVGFIGNLAKSAQFAYNVIGKVDMPADDKALQISKDFLSRFPVSNHAMQALMQYNLGMKYDSKGRALVEVSKGEAVAAAAGFRSQGEAQLRAAQADYWGPFRGAMGDTDNNLKAHADETFKWMGPMLRRMAAEDGVTPAQVWQNFEEHAITYNAALTPAQQRVYFGHLSQLVGSMDVTQSARFAEILTRDFKDDSKGHLMFGEDARDYVRRNPFPGSDKLVEQLDIMLDIKALLTGTDGDK
ncbi:MAG: hypothetical protein RBS78_00960 [Coriobacteriia bacterium]|jgi:hypothetical protein|nr:hypothetical protein [Coriobacteriia bacterium]